MVVLQTITGFSVICAAISGSNLSDHKSTSAQTETLLTGTDAADVVSHASQLHSKAGKRGKKAWCLAGNSCYSESGLTAVVNNPFHSSVGVQA